MYCIFFEYSYYYQDHVSLCISFDFHSNSIHVRLAFGSYIRDVYAYFVGTLNYFENIAYCLLHVGWYTEFHVHALDKTDANVVD